MLYNQLYSSHVALRVQFKFTTDFSEDMQH